MIYWRWTILIIILICTFFVWQAVWQSESNFLKVVFLDVGQGDAVFIEGPGGSQVLIDGGKDKSALRQLSKVIPWSDRFIDVVIATHPDADHIGGLPAVLERFNVGVVVDSGVSSDTSIFRYYQKTIDDKNLTVLQAEPGMKINLGEDVYILILGPEKNSYHADTNDASIITKLVYGDTAFMLTGDASAKIERSLIFKKESDLRSAVLKAGHHGSKTSSDQNFLEMVKPEYVVISAGEGNRYGHPHKEIVNRIENLGAIIFSTADSGNIIFKVGPVE